VEHLPQVALDGWQYRLARRRPCGEYHLAFVEDCPGNVHQSHPAVAYAEVNGKYQVVGRP
jgi:hypothetical protein